VVYTIQHYVIKFVSYLRQVGGFLLVIRFPPNNSQNHKLIDMICSTWCNLFSLLRYKLIDGIVVFIYIKATFNTNRPRYNWNIVESGVKHHKTKPSKSSITLLKDFFSIQFLFVLNVAFIYIKTVFIYIHVFSETNSENPYNLYNNGMNQQLLVIEWSLYLEKYLQSWKSISLYLSIENKLHHVEQIISINLCFWELFFNFVDIFLSKDFIQ
jgi:hypothetical protein